MRKIEKRIMALAVILFSFFYQSSSSQCLEDHNTTGNETIRGLVTHSNNYYRNLIIQDIALASQLATGDVSISFDYKLHYQVDQCGRDQVGLKVLPICSRCYPLEYRGFDISGTVRPEKADLVFQVVNEIGILTGEMLMKDIPLEKDSSLYTLRQFVRKPEDGRLTFRFSEALFYYTRKSYNDFRDKMLEIDWYYASSEMADSVMQWKTNGFLQETDNLPSFFLSQFELERILGHISFDTNFLHRGSAVYDPAGLIEKISDLTRLNMRYRTILSHNMSHNELSFSITEMKSIAGSLLDRLDFYHDIAFREDFRNAGLLEKLAAPGFSNGFLIHYGKHLAVEYNCHPAQIEAMADILCGSLFRKGYDHESSGNQLRALEYYEAASKIAMFGRSFPGKDSLFTWICRMKSEIVNSYLDISKKACLAGNPSMAATYYREARKLVANDGYTLCGSFPLNGFENWLYGSFLEKSRELLARNEYRKAIPYLEEIQSGCGPNASFACPEELQDLFRQARQGIYLELLYQADNLLRQEEYADAEVLLEQTGNIRIASGYAIPKEPMETRIEGVLRQRHYEEYLEEGSKNFFWKEYDIALYYFNKAFILERENLPEPDPRLAGLRRDAARQVILRLMSDTRTRAVMYDFQGYKVYLEKVSDMINEYDFQPGDDVVASFSALQNDASVLLCNKVRIEYDALYAHVLEAKNTGNYILARKLAGETVNYSLDHLECGIKDSDAWYEKVILEPLAVYQEKTIKMEQFAGVTPTEYLGSYQDLREYYYKNSLLGHGLILESFHQMAMRSTHPDFLIMMLGYYIRQNNLSQGLDVMHKLHDLGANPDLLSDEQKYLAQLFVQRDVILNTGDDPWEILDTYVSDDKWYSDFRWSYKLNWIAKSGGNIRYWPFIWKK